MYRDTKKVPDSKSFESIRLKVILAWNYIYLIKAMGVLGQIGGNWVSVPQIMGRDYSH